MNQKSAVTLTSTVALAFPLCAAEITLQYQCEGCAVKPLPTKVIFNDETKIFESFTVRWNQIDFDFTFPNSQPAFVRQWFWDALRGQPVTPTSLPDSGAAEVFEIHWLADTYTPSQYACFSFRLGASGAGPRCVMPPHDPNTLYPVNITGITNAALPFVGFFAPVDNVPTLNTTKAGSAIPVKFGLGGDRGLDVIASGFPVSKQIACPSGAAVDAIEELTVTAGNSTLAYDIATQTYTYAWKTEKAWGNTCRELNVRLKDGTDHKALFMFKK